MFVYFYTTRPPAIKATIKYVSTHWNEVLWRPLCWKQRGDPNAGSRDEPYPFWGTRTARKVSFVTSIIRGRLYSKYVCEEDSFEELYFMLDGITRRFALYVRAWLEEFVGRWIGRWGPMSSRNSRSYSLWSTFVGVGQRCGLPIKTGNTWNIKFEIILPPFQKNARDFLRLTGAET